MTFTETNKGSKSTFVYKWISFKSEFWTKKLTFMHLYCIQSIEGFKKGSCQFLAEVCG